MCIHIYIYIYIYVHVHVDMGPSLGHLEHWDRFQFGAARLQQANAFSSRGVEWVAVSDGPR